ncbi:ketopantoate reductase family protein [Pontibacter harenae]|uniref:ketopantoate reductase family protein n=1 Tax=Pontibacter harenae TaxID=2894083 RepID=UPI001E624573|nr:2-dehydropantoate 2-reductase N-terminal domain-containing protein [Pontibacter harenae]MCC9165525.1 hypothetical protein [Pontibacter harenae]
MQKKFRIAVVGIGGVGGFYGAKLAQQYASSENHEIIFIARGDHKAKIAEQGLVLDYADTREAIKPDLVTNNLEELGKLDLILFCVKSYSLNTVAKALEGSIDESTYLLPLLNGVESIEYLSQLYPKSKLLWGCTYIISSVAAPGEVKVQGKLNRLVWGNPGLRNEDLAQIRQLFDEAGIHNELYEDIKDKVWEKFSFISPLGSFTSSTNVPAGNILRN